jgi:hypothetical protein
MNRPITPSIGEINGQRSDCDTHLLFLGCVGGAWALERRK